MIPITRKDHYLNEIVGWGDTAPEKPYIEEEFFFAEILGEAVQAPEPLPRYQMYLAKIAGRDVEIPYPETRLEYFLARAAGMEIETPIPITREEMLWDTYIPIKTIEGIPPLTFKAKKAGTLKNYRIYGNTETKTRSYSGSAPLSFPIVDGAVSNYRIYGNTENGESVGDKTANILPLSRTPITETHGDFLCEYDGLGTITLTTDKDNATTDGEFVIPLIQDFTIPVSIGQGGTGCLQINNDCYGSSLGNISFVYNSTAIDTWSLNALNRIHSSYNVLGNKIVNQIAIYIVHSISYRKITIRPAFVENVTEQVPFEPYGFKIPITNNSENANIYLDEPLRKVGDEAEYVDYAEQKRYNADGTNEDVTLPALPAQSSSNSLSVGTTVQPSSVGVDVGEIVSCGDMVTDSQSVNYGKYKIPVTLTADSAETTDIYLDEPLAKSGNNADYIDYATQKRQNSDGTESTVILPEIAVTAGTNTLTVGTEVQPSGVEIKGKIQEVTL